MPNYADMTQSDDPEFVNWLTSFSTEDIPLLLGRLFVSILIFLIGRYVVMLIVRVVRRNLAGRGQNALAIDFFDKALYIVGLVIVTIIALGNLGIPMTSLIAVLGASALAIGLALQDSLSNLASGLLIIMLNTYRVGDSIEVGEDRLVGTVDSVHFFHTVLRMADNSLLLMPNREVMGNPIVNFTNLGWRRIDLQYSIGYDGDLQRAKQILQEIAAADLRILKEPATVIAVNSLSDTGVDLIFQPHVSPASYASVKYDLNEQVKLRFDEAGIVLAAPRPMRLVQ
jgi:small conductance mechanosensitive channel